MSRAEFRASTPHDQKELAKFLGAVFGSAPDEPYLEEEHMQWKYWQARADWRWPRSFVMARGEQIVGHGAAWPLHISTPEGGSVPAFHLIDWAADPKFPLAGVSVMKRMTEIADVVCVFGGSDEALKMRHAMGFRPRNTVEILVKPLRAWKQMTTHQTKGWKQPLRFARNLAWSWSARGIEAGWEAVELEPEDFSALLEAVKQQQPELETRFERSAAEWNYLASCPTATFRFYAVQQSGRICGYFSLAFVPGQARIADAVLLTRNGWGWNQLGRLAARAAVSDAVDASELVAYAVGVAARTGLRSAGFRLHRADQVLLLDAAARVNANAALDLQMTHGDMAFWHRGTPLYLS